MSPILIKKKRITLSKSVFAVLAIGATILTAVFDLSEQPTLVQATAINHSMTTEVTAPQPTEQQLKVTVISAHSPHNAPHSIEQLTATAKFVVDPLLYTEQSDTTTTSDRHSQ